jgi:hypothetical protein
MANRTNAPAQSNAERNWAQSNVESNCRVPMATPIADLQVLDFPQRVACEVISGASQSFNSIRADAKDSVQWVKDTVGGKVSTTELITAVAASPLVVGMAVEGKRDPQAEKAAESAVGWAQRALQLARGLFRSGSPR